MTSTNLRRALAAANEFDGAALRAARQGLGLSQARLAAELGLTEDAVYKMESGQRPVERRTAMAIILLELAGPVLDKPY